MRKPLSDRTKLTAFAAFALMIGCLIITAGAELAYRKAESDKQPTDSEKLEVVLQYLPAVEVRLRYLEEITEHLGPPPK